MKKLLGWQKVLGLTIFLFSILSLVGNWKPTPSLAAPVQATPPKMVVRAGFEGYYKQASWLPIQFNLSLAENNSNFEGWVEASQTNFKEDALLVRRNVQLTAPSNRTVWLYMPIGQRFINEVQVRLTDQAGKVIVTDKLDVRGLTEADLLIGVLGNDTAHSALNSLTGEKFTQPFKLVGSSQYFPSGYPYQATQSNVRKEPQARFVKISPADLPSDTSGWESLDGLIVSNLGSFNLGDPSLNTETMRNAAAGWLAEGRFLFVAGDDALRKSGFLTDFLPVKPNATPQNRPVPTILINAVGKNNLPTTVSLAEVGLLPGAVNLISDTNKSLLAKRSLGLGTVFFFATEFNNLPTNLNKFIFQQALSNYEPRFSFVSQQKMFSDTGPNRITMISPSTQLSVLPDIGLVLGTLVVYVLLVGPITYLLLKRLNRRELGWVFIPIMALLLTAGIYTIAQLTSGDPLVFSKLTIITAGETNSGKSVGTTTALATVYSNQRVEFGLGVAEDAVSVPLNSSFYYRQDKSNLPINVLQQGANATYEKIYMGLSDQRTFISAKNGISSNLGGGFRMQLKLVGNDLTGTIENLTGTEWLDLGLWLPNAKIYRIPKIGAGAKITLSNDYLVKPGNKSLAGALTDIDDSTSNGYYRYYQRFTNVNYAEQRYEVLQSVIGENGRDVPNDRAYFFAWKRESLDFPLRLESKSAKQVNLTLFWQTVNLQ